MKKLGFLISNKIGEERKAILPNDLHTIKNLQNLYFEKGYGECFGISDQEYLNAGCHIASREEILKCDVIVDVKLGDGDYLDEIDDDKILFGWAHAKQMLDFTTSCMKKRHTVIAWEEMFDNGKYIFYKNREVAGEAAIMHGFRYSKKMPYDAKVAVIGNGQTAKGALRILHGTGADVEVFPRKHEELFKKKMFDFDVIVNCVMWDTRRTDRLIYREDIKKMRPGTLIIDVSCDHGLEIETSHPTSITDPVFTVDGVVHYCVDNTPAMFPLTVTKGLSHTLAQYIDQVVTSDYENTIKDAIVINKGEIMYSDIIEYRKSKGIL